MVGGGTLSSHSIQPADITIRGKKALALSTGSVNIRVSIDGTEYEMVSLVRFVSRLQHIQLPLHWEWRLLTLDAVYDRDYIIPIQPVSARSTIISPPPEARRSYKYLDCVLSRQGFTIAKDLPGTDDENTIAILFEENDRWLSSD